MDSGFMDFFRQLPPVITVVFCGSALLLVVALVGIVSARARRTRLATAAPAPASIGGEMPDLDLLLGAEANPVDAPSKRSGTYPVTVTDGRTIEAAEVMTIARDLADGSLIIQIGGKAYRNAAEIEGEEAKRRFVNAVRELARLSSETARGLGAEAASHAATSAAPAAETPRRTPLPPPSTDGVMPGDLPRYSEMERPVVRPRKRRGQAEPPLPEINLADAIEAYLQHKLKYTPEYDGRSIHVRGGTGGGVAIEVDGRYYETVDDVTDRTIREFLTETIDEWQSRQ